MSTSRECEFVNDTERSQMLAKCFNVNLEREGIDQLIGHECSVEDPILKIEEHLAFLKRVDARLHSLFTLAVNIIFCGGSSYAVGGTTSGAVGVVWGNPERHWEACDYLEYFTHELTHTLMFLDELRFLHYREQEIMYHKENFSLSAILQAERPIDRVLHSIVVATEVLMLRSKNHINHSKCHIHPSTASLVESTLTSIDKLLLHKNRDRILTPRALEIVHTCQNNLSQHLALTL